MATARKKKTAKKKRATKKKPDTKSAPTKKAGPTKKTAPAKKKRVTKKKRAIKKRAVAKAPTTDKAAPAKKKRVTKKKRAIGTPTAVKKTHALGRRAVIVAAVRTPFLAPFAAYAETNSVDLGISAVRSLLRISQVDPGAVEAVTWAGTILPGTDPHIARRIALGSGLSPALDALTLTRGATGGLAALTEAAARIERGEVDVIVAGGSDSASHAEMRLPPRVAQALVPLLRKRASFLEYLGAAAHLAPFFDLLPESPSAIAPEAMEAHAIAVSAMARTLGISREEQDAFATRSHRLAGKATATHRLDAEVAAVETRDGLWVHTDGLVRREQSEGRLARAPSLGDHTGSVTAGNAAPVADGAATILLMDEGRARTLGHVPLCAVRGWGHGAADPTESTLAATGRAIARALSKAGTELGAMQSVELHEGTAAETLGLLRVLADDRYASRFLGLPGAVGNIALDTLNARGGSLAFGHPPAATGVRLAASLAHEIGRPGSGFGLVSAGDSMGLGTAAVLEPIA